ncbi:MAG TPA: 30S ribosomal protein S13, partial [Patescibacteria group bacterium]|nr:30S ribosomal protein S13 [Patescibacteria group bacterium]
MARIAGVNIPNEKRIVIALTYVFGIGMARARDIVKSLNIDPNTRTKDLSEEIINKL